MFVSAAAYCLITGLVVDFKIEIEDISNDENPNYKVYDIVSEKGEIHVTVFNDSALAEEILELINKKGDSS